MTVRNRSRFGLLLVAILLFSIVLSACQPAATTPAPTTPAPSTTAKPVVTTPGQTTAAPTPPPTTPVPTTTTEKPRELYPFSIFRTAWTTLDHEKDPIILELNKKFNIKISIVTAPYESWIEKYNIFVTTNDIPDLSVTTGPGTANFNDWAKQKIYIDLYELYKKHCPNIQKYLGADVVEAHRMDGGKLYGIPKPSISDSTHAIRQDWLDALGLKVPKTLDDLYEVAKQFKEKDPDKNGKDDTYGLISEDTLNAINFVFRAFGCSVPPNIAENWVPDPADKNKLTTCLLQTGMKDAIAYVNKLFRDGILDPEWMLTKSTAYSDKVRTGKVGIMNSSYSKLPVSETEIQPADPNVKLTLLEGVNGPGGTFVRPMQKGFYMVSSVSSKAKEPVRILEFIDYLMTDEGDEMIRYGLEGLTFKREGGKIVWNSEAAKTYGWQNGHPFRQIMQPTPVVVTPATDPRATALAEAAKIIFKGPFYPASTLTPPSLKEVATKQGADFVKNQVTAIVTTTGDPKAEWDKFIAEWRSTGGDTLIKEINDMYAANRK